MQRYKTFFTNAILTIKKLWSIRNPNILPPKRPMTQNWILMHSYHVCDPPLMGEYRQKPAYSHLRHQRGHGT